MLTFFEQILENHPDLILVKREKSQIVWGNRAFRDLYGMSNEELRGLIDHPVVEPNYTLQYIQDDQWVWKNGKPLQIDCEPVMRHDGVVRKFSTLKYPLFDTKGRVIYTVGVSRDITDAIELEQSVENQAKMAALGEIASNIAHEINNPLTVILGKAHQLARAFTEKLDWSDVKILANLKAIVDYSKRIDQIIKGLRNYGRDGSQDPFEEVNLRSLVDETLILCKGQMAKREIEMNISIPEEIQVECRPVQISQILVNLLNNAMDAVSSSPESERKIWMVGEMMEDQVSVLVRDSGAGVPPEIITKIMQPFFTTKGKGKGTGLGLSVSDQLAKSHSGALRLDPSISSSCFRLTLPKRQQAVRTHLTS
ncbi:MAG: PAS domain-containing protein [Bdellovibrionales bacterium]|nr:PAS domain-containing protein [Bdellovibrionales bacterium]